MSDDDTLEAVDILVGYERWEGQLVLFGEWNTRDGMPKLTQDLYDVLMDLQQRRNKLLQRLRSCLQLGEAGVL